MVNGLPLVDRGREIRVGEKDRTAATLSHSGANRGAFSPVFRKLDELDRFARGAGDRRGIVGGAIVHDDHFEAGR